MRAAKWERLSFICWYQSPFGSGQAVHVRLVQNPRQELQQCAGPGSGLDRMGPRVPEDLDQNRPITDELSIFCISCWIRPAPRQPVCRKKQCLRRQKEGNGHSRESPFFREGGGNPTRAAQRCASAPGNWQIQPSERENGLKIKLWRI